VNRVRFTRRAREDLLDIWLYIAPRSSEAVADQIYDRIEERCQLLKEHPQLGPARPEIAEDARALVIERWLVLYRLVDDGAQVVRIVDGSRDLTQIEWPPE
jgi:toxin ParE1/3/4